MSPRSTRSRGGTGQAASPHCGQPCVWFAAAQPAGTEFVSMYAPQSMMWMHGTATGPQVVEYGEVSTRPLLVSPLAAVYTSAPSASYLRRLALAVEARARELRRATRHRR